MNLKELIKKCWFWLIVILVLTVTIEDGTISFDAAKCTGCGLCIFACPFGVISFDWTDKMIHNCDLCAKRLAEGKPPACVITCPTQALSYGEYEAFTQEAKRKAALAMVRAMPPGPVLSPVEGATVS